MNVRGAASGQPLIALVNSQHAAARADGATAPVAEQRTPTPRDELILNHGPAAFAVPSSDQQKRPNDLTTAESLARSLQAVFEASIDLGIEFPPEDPLALASEVAEKIHARVRSELSIGAATLTTPPRRLSSNLFRTLFPPVRMAGEFQPVPLTPEFGPTGKFG